MMAVKQCPVCKSSQLTTRFEGYTHRAPKSPDRWVVQACQPCGHSFINPRPSATQLAAFYSASYEPYSKSHGSESNDEEVVQQAKRQGEFRHVPVPQGKRVLDFGCGGGYFLHICKLLGAQPYGIEPSAHGAKLVQEQGIPVFNGSIEDYMAKEGPDQRKFDLITANHVLEHTGDPIGVLAALKQLLSPGGMIWISVPNGASRYANELGKDWHSFDLPYHLHHFSPNSLKLAGASAGLVLKRQYTYSLPSASAASHRLVWRKKYLIPQRLTMRMPSFDRYVANPAAKHNDAQNLGEAIICEFA